MSKRIRYRQASDGDLIFPRMDGWKMRCCDCGLTHLFVFAVVEHRGRNVIAFEVRRDNRATAATRRGRKSRTSPRAVPREDR